MLRTLSGLFLVGALNRPRKRKRTNRENPRRVPKQIGKIPEKSGKSQKGQKRTKKEGQVQIGKPPRLKHPRLAALDICIRGDKLLAKRPCLHSKRPLRRANAQPFLCNELGPFQAIFRQFTWALSGNFRQFSGNFQAISGNFRQFRVI